ncbi:hypothetical protein GCM10028807_42660 [Spirosoma daeguense]
MTIELYSAPVADSADVVDSPISNITGELPDQEPELNADNLLGSFDTRDEALAFIESGLLVENQKVADTEIRPFDPYTHVELLTVTLQQEDHSTTTRQYYLVNDEGY